MTRKDYERIAAVFRSKLELPYAQTPVRTACLRDVAFDLCLIFKSDNPNFNQARFIEACGFTDKNL